MMIDLIIFSKNRAFQLQALLSSLRENCDIFANISIIYKATDKSFQAGYEKLMSFNVSLDVDFVEEYDLRQNVLVSIKKYPNKFLCFLTDDQICYRNITEVYKGTAETLLESFSDEKICHSLRLGANCRNFPEEPKREPLKKDLFVFQWHNQSKSFAYPLSVDGHIFKKDYILSLIQQVGFDNPNKLEAWLQYFKVTAPKYMSCFEKSLFVGVPINKVSDTSSCSFGEKYPLSVRCLNDLFLQGKTLDRDKMDFNNVIDIHQEIKFEIVSRRKQAGK